MHAFREIRASFLLGEGFIGGTTCRGAGLWTSLKKKQLDWWFFVAGRGRRRPVFHAARKVAGDRTAGPPFCESFSCECRGKLAATDGAEHTNLAAKFGRLPLSFEPNLGQSDPQVRFTARGNGYDLFLTPAEAVVSLVAPRKRSRRSGIERATPSPASARASVVGMEFVGATDSAEIAGSDPLPGVSNYFIGDDPRHWATGVPALRARQLWRAFIPGIGLQFSGQGPELGLGFAVAPESDPNLIHLRFTGANQRELRRRRRAGNRCGKRRTARPHATRLPAIRRQAARLDANYEASRATRLCCSLGAYDHGRDLVIEAASADSATSPAASRPRIALCCCRLAWVPHHRHRVGRGGTHASKKTARSPASLPVHFRSGCPGRMRQRSRAVVAEAVVGWRRWRRRWRNRRV